IVGAFGKTLGLAPEGVKLLLQPTRRSLVKRTVKEKRLARLSHIAFASSCIANNIKNTISLIVSSSSVFTFANQYGRGSSNLRGKRVPLLRSLEHPRKFLNLKEIRVVREGAKLILCVMRCRQVGAFNWKWDSS
uniref:Ig-like domain-containing protein n=1 Tax=Steinernema glaseri TaxID=37863 RepID=A0A1I7YHX8_9BILA